MMIRSETVRWKRRGVSLVELMVAMTGVSMVLAMTAALLHGVLRAQSESRLFFDDERASIRLARQFRADVHAACGMTTAAAAKPDSAEAETLRLAALLLPDGRTVEYSLAAGRQGLMRLIIPFGGNGLVAREDFRFAGPLAAAITTHSPANGRRVTLAIGPRPDAPELGDRSPGTPSALGKPVPRSSAEARRKPPALAIDADLGRDLRFTQPATAEEPR